MTAWGREPEPAAVYRYLVPREVQVLTLRQHLAFLVQPAAAAVGAALAAGVVSVVTPGDMTLKIVVWVLAGFLIVRLIVAGISWSIQYITVTSVRVVLTSGVFNRKVKVIPLPNFAEMTFSRSFAGRMLGYGTFMVEATGKPYLIIDYISYPEQVQLIITEGALPKSAADSDDNDDAEPPLAPRSGPFGLRDYVDYADSTPAGYQEPFGPADVTRAQIPPDDEAPPAGKTEPEDKTPPEDKAPPQEEPGRPTGATDSDDPGRRADED